MLKANKCAKSLIFWLFIVLSSVGLILMFRCAFLKAPEDLSDPKLSSFLIPFLQIDGYFSYKQLKNNVFAFKIIKNGIFGSEFCAYKI